MTTTVLTRPDRCIAPKPSLAGYKIHACRCADCTEASRIYAARRDRLIAYGRWQPMVDAEPVRQHIRTLMAHGIGWQRVAAGAGVSTGGVSRILYGGTNGGPCKKVKKATADAILAVRPSIDLLTDGSTVDATGTRRRTESMAALGWSVSYQAQRVGRTIRNHSYVLTADRVTVKLARAVAELYEELSVRTPPPGPRTTRVRRWAARRGYAPPAAWEDETIDDPAAVPNLGGDGGDLIDEIAVERALTGERVNLTRAEKQHAITVGLRRRMTVSSIARAIGMSNTRCKEIARQLQAA